MYIALSALTFEQALSKLQRYCAYQERCHQEVRNKLIRIKVFGEDQDEVINALIAEGFLNEERYARTFVSGKSRIKRWGEVKILAQLKAKGISDYCIRKGMEEYEDALKLDNMRYWFVKWTDQYNNLEPFLFKDKILKMYLSKGYRVEEVLNFLKTES